MSAATILEISNLTYRAAGHPLLDNISLTLDAEYLSVILGPNGAGKTLLMKACTRLIAPSTGRIVWHNEVEAGCHYTLVFQTPVLLRRTALANIIYALHALPKAERESRASAALRWAGCEQLATKAAQNLSSGQQQLVALARAWAIAPKVLFLDEPCANLDPAVSLRLEQLIRELHQQGVKVVMTTHNLAQAQRLAGDIIFMEKGRIAEQAMAIDFFNNPQSESARRYLALESTQTSAELKKNRRTTQETLS